MRWMCLGLLFLASAAWALEPLAGAGPLASPSPAAGTATAAPLSGTAAPVAATAVPTPAASAPAAAVPGSVAPAPDTVPPPDIPHVLTDFRPDWGVALRAGAALPLGGHTAAASMGGMGGLDVLYHATENSEVDLMGLYADMPDADSVDQPSPVSTAGLAAKLDYDVYRQDKLAVWLGLGVGYMAIQSTNHIAKVSEGSISYTTAPQTAYGVALLACAGAGYAFYPDWSLNLELVVLSLDSDGGSSNNLLAALPDLYLKWIY